MRYVIWFNGNNWEAQEFREAQDAAHFVDTFEDADASKGFMWFITTESGKELLIDQGIVFL